MRLSVEGLGHRYPGAAQPALADVSLRLEGGTVLGLLGPNGAGKSTLMAHLTGAIAPQQGALQVEGQPLAEHRRRQPHAIAMAPQSLAFYPMLTVAENLALFAGAAGLRGAQRRARIEASSAAGQLQPWHRTRAGQLSGGLQRRLNLAIALLGAPKLLLLDEPTVGVDPQSRAFLLDTVRQLAHDGTTVIYASHYMDEIEAVADRVAILDRGRIIRQDTLAALLADATPTLRLALADAARAQPVLQRFGDVQPMGRTVQLALRTGVAPAQVLAALDAAGVVIEQASFGRQTLEDLFLALTERTLRDAA